MTDFERKREEYFKKIASNETIFRSIVENAMMSGDEKDIKLARLVGDPQTEETLDTANIVFDIIKDMNELELTAVCHEVKPVSIEESRTYEIFIELIKRLKNGEDISSFCRDMSEEDQAEILYGSYVQPDIPEEECFKYVAEKTGVDFNNPDQQEEFLIMFSEAAKEIDEVRGPITSLDQLTGEEKESYRKFSKIFHKMCEERRTVKPEESFDRKLEKIMGLYTEEK